MADETVRRPTGSGSGSATIWLRPSLLLMKFPLKAAEATLELGLAKLKGQREAAAAWLRRLGAVRVEFGEPHFAEQAEVDPVVKMQALSAKAMRKLAPEAAPAPSPGRAVRVVLTALWDVAAMSAEETLTLLDRLRFETTADVPPEEAAEGPASWANPEDQLRAIFSHFAQLVPDTVTPEFLFLSRPGEDALEKATAEAFAAARHSADRLARAAGMTLGALVSALYRVSTVPDNRPHRVMERQRSATLLAGTAYDLREDEVASDDPRPVDVSVSVNVTYYLE
jgi:hypothetical protein